jgi:carboxypeptidase Q
MRYTTIILFLFLSTLLHAQVNQDSIMLKRIFDEELSHGKCNDNLRELCKGYGKRLTGSPIAAGAVEWSYNKMKSYGFDTAYKQEVMVPHWVRGRKETASYITSRSPYPKPGVPPTPVSICALGGSIGGNISGQVIEVKSFEELRALGKEKVKGKIVFFNRPMDDTKINTFSAYGGAVNQRGRGAVEAGYLGAIGVIVRTMSVGINPYPHTGAMHYADTVVKIPACAISTLDAEKLSADLKQYPFILLSYEMFCKTLPDTLSHNVICEIRGSEHPEEIIVMGGHLDAWDMAEGAHDDGSGVTQCLEALRLMKQLGIKPKHTIRCVFFMNEENGLRGGTKYAEIAKLKKERTILALESDEGGFTPRGFAFDATGDTLNRLCNFKKLFAPYYMDDLHHGGGGSDIGPLQDLGCVLMSLNPDTQRYFDFHHAATDVFEGVNKREQEMGAAGITGIIYLIDEYGL